METVVKRTYEGLFLVDSGEAAADWKQVTGAIEKILSRSEAEVVSLRKWDDRRLAYEINKKNRGTYILAYFDCDPDRIGSIERDVQLSEKVIRVLILRTDRMTAEMMDKATPAMVESAAAEARVAAAEARAAEAIAAAEAKAAEAAVEAEAVPEESEDTKPEDSPPEDSDDAKPEDSLPATSADKSPGESESAESVDSVEPVESEAAEESDDKE
ncbi:MAG: 30S ribosomal protein S6 [Planctomycetes bacterium]|nr:30S ribosomal protein S6 [Planctomycetota bacterium]